jgi:hypothetical protein
MKAYWGSEETEIFNLSVQFIAEILGLFLTIRIEVPEIRVASPALLAIRHVIFVVPTLNIVKHIQIFYRSPVINFCPNASFEAVTAVTFQVEVFRIMTRCRDVVGYHRFKGPRLIHLQGDIEVSCSCAFFN